MHRAITLAAACCTLLKSTWRHLQLLPQLYDVRNRQPFSEAFLLCDGHLSSLDVDPSARLMPRMLLIGRRTRQRCCRQALSRAPTHSVGHIERDISAALDRPRTEVPPGVVGQTAVASAVTSHLQAARQIRKRRKLLISEQTDCDAKLWPQETGSHGPCCKMSHLVARGRHMHPRLRVGPVPNSGRPTVANTDALRSMHLLAAAVAPVSSC